MTGVGAAGPAFVAELELSAIDEAGAADVALALVLPCWTLLGMLDRAIELTIAHVSLRKQFGQPLSAFQGVQFQLTDAEVERSGLDILTKYALWSVGTHRREALDDALALRMSASKPPRSSSGCATSYTAQLGSATRRHCPGSPATASRCDGCRWACPQRATC